MNTLLRATLASLLLIALAHTASAQASIQTTKPDGTPNRAAWMAQGSFGVMTHYLLKPEGATPEEQAADLNRMVDNFDLDSYIAQFEATGADWLIFTLMQGTGFLSSKSEFIDNLRPGITRTAISFPEIGRRLHERGKRLIVYMPHGQTGADPVVKSLLGLGTEALPSGRAWPPRTRSRARVVDGWWFDSCGPQDNATWEEEMAACRAGNPMRSSPSAARCAGGGNIAPRCPIEDYHAGEIHLLEDGESARTSSTRPVKTTSSLRPTASSGSGARRRSSTCPTGSSSTMCSGTGSCPST